MSPRRRPLALVVLVALAATALGLVAAAPAGASAQGDPRGAFRSYETPNPPSGPGDKVISLTFDDGPRPGSTPQVLDILTRYGLRATFFEIGRQAERYPDLVKAIVAQGSIVANHSWDHVSLRPLDDARFVFEVDHTTQVIEQVSGQHVVCARPPYGDSDARVVGRLADRGLTSVLWTADSDDFAKPGVQAIVNNAMAHLQPGGIILFHDGGGNRDQTIAALPIVIERILAAGYRIAPICAPDPHAPVGKITTAQGGRPGKITATGWASDPDSKDPTEVHLYVDGVFVSQAKANGPGTPGPTWSTVVTTGPGHHRVCAFAINIGAGLDNPSLGCAETDVPPITAFDDLLPLAAQARFVQLREQAVVLQKVVRVHDARRLPWRAQAAVGLGRPALAR